MSRGLGARPRLMGRCISLPPWARGARKEVGGRGVRGVVSMAQRGPLRRWTVRGKSRARAGRHRAAGWASKNLTARCRTRFTCWCRLCSLTHSPGARVWRGWAVGRAKVKGSLTRLRGSLTRPRLISVSTRSSICVPCWNPPRFCVTRGALRHRSRNGHRRWALWCLNWKRSRKELSAVCRCCAYGRG